MPGKAWGTGTRQYAEVLPLGGAGLLRFQSVCRSCALHVLWRQVEYPRRPTRSQVQFEIVDKRVAFADNGTLIPGGRGPYNVSIVLKVCGGRGPMGASRT